MSNKTGKSPSTTPNKRNRVTWAQAVRDMVTSAINKGQLPLFGLLFVVVCLIFKMPPEDVSKLVFAIFEALKAGDLVGYVIAVVLGGCWYGHARLMRKQYSAEYERIGKEKTSLQSQVGGVTYRSSDRK
ncbi:hypothetical protein ACOTFH_29865 [Achromobacter xylosoxidans]